MAQSLLLSDLETGPINLGSPPAEAELLKMAALGLGMDRGARASLMNAIAGRLLMPAGGFRGQSRLFVKGDIRLVGVLALMTRESAAKNIAANLARARQYSDTNTFLTLVTTAREHASALTAATDRMVDSWHEGGIDFLWKTKDLLGLPKSVTSRWEPIPEFKSIETGHMVYPASIPARDQTMVYAAQISSSFRRNFGTYLLSEVGPEAATMLAASSRVARLVWQEYSFLAPGGHLYHPEQRTPSQIGRGFGSQTALSYIIKSGRSIDLGRSGTLNQILTDPMLNHTEWVRSSKTRVAETLFLERLLTAVRELKFPSGW
jgi:hypothetical protein